MAPTTTAFRSKVLSYFKKHGRKFPWRETRDPFAILVSEIMLQQTQTERVLKYYERFLTEFDSFETLAAAPLDRVLKVWQGLGYNRRALKLREAARVIVSDFGGKLPDNEEALLSLPGIGKYTASALLAFVFNKPSVFIETNIRTVYIHSFCSVRRKKIGDPELLTLIENTLDRRDPRTWYYALMDYGVYLKKEYPSVSAKSKHYRKAPAFKGSNREIRGALIRELTERGASSTKSLVSRLKLISDDFTEARVVKQLSLIEKEGFVVRKKGRIAIGG